VAQHDISFVAPNQRMSGDTTWTGGRQVQHLENKSLDAFVYLVFLSHSARAGFVNGALDISGFWAQNWGTVLDINLATPVVASRVLGQLAGWVAGLRPCCVAWTSGWVPVCGWGLRIGGRIFETMVPKLGPKIGPKIGFKNGT
jgi:hypothetical protein